MSISEKFIVLPFRKIGKGRVVLSDMRQASCEAAAERLVGKIAPRFAGVSAFAVMVDDDTGVMSEPRLIIRQGETLDMMAEAW